MQFTATLEDGTTFTVSPRFADKVAFEAYLANRSIGTMATNVFRMQAFCAWRAGKREEKTSLTFDEFMNQLADIDAAELATDSDESDELAEIDGVSLGKDGLADQPTS